MRSSLHILWVVTAALSVGCGPIEVTDAGEGPEVSSECVTNTRGDCVLSSETCSADAIEVRENGVTCATCEEESGDVEICGATIEARCVEQENAFGDSCQRCVTDDGQILYDDCYGANARVDGLICESAGVAVEAPEDMQAPEDPDEEPAPPVIDETTECEVCRDESGQVVSTRCAPVADECTETESAGRLCVECRTDGVVVYRKCEPLEIDPRVCVTYADEDGVCIDCYGQDDELLTHECVVGGNTLGYCEDERTPEGYVCSRCFSTAGLLLEESCYFEPPTAERCQELVYTDQSCLACISEFGELVSLECWATNCEPSPNGDVACPEPEPCELIFNDAGVLCRICPTVVDGIFVEESQCVGPSQLTCYVEVNIVEGSDGADPNSPDAALIEQRCHVCFDETQTEVYRQCEDVGTAPPPVCEVYTNFAGDLCETCFDPATGSTFYSSCAGESVCYEEPSADGEVCITCYDSQTGEIIDSSCGIDVCSTASGLPVLDENGAAVKHPTTEAHVELIADCSMCGDDASNTLDTSCVVTNACVDPTTGDPGLWPGPNGCANLVVLWMEVPQCERAWGDGAQGMDEALRIIAWGATDLGVLFHGVTLTPSVGEDCEACSCAAGTRLDVYVDETLAESLLSANVGFSAN